MISRLRVLAVGLLFVGLSRVAMGEQGNESESPVAAARRGVLQLVIQNSLGKDIGSGTAAVLPVKRFD